MNLLVCLDSNAKPGERGWVGGKRYRVMVNGRALDRCTFVFAVLGFGMAMFYTMKDQRLQVINGWAVTGITFGRIKVEPL